MQRVTVILGGVLVLALLAGGLTEATLAIGHRGGIADDALLRPRVSATPSPSVSASPAVSPSASPTPILTPTPSATPVGRYAVTNSFVHLRAGKSIYTNILIDLNAGTQVQVLPDSDAQWQQVQYSGLTGYIFKAYLIY